MTQAEYIEKTQAEKRKNASEDAKKSES